MHRTLTLYGRREEVQPGTDESALFVEWNEAVNFHEAASHLISGEFESAVILPVNCTPGVTDASAVRITIDRNATNFRGFTAHFWLHDTPYDSKHIEGTLEAFDFDWVAFIPCASMLTG